VPGTTFFKMDKKGITLIAVILLMTLLAITVVGLTTFVVERLRLTSTRQNEINAYYMAQAGIHYGIWIYETSGTESGTYDDYEDRGFDWNATADGNNLTVTSTGYSPKTGDRIEKVLVATYDRGSGQLTTLGYQQ